MLYFLNGNNEHKKYFLEEQFYDISRSTYEDIEGKKYSVDKCFFLWVELVVKRISLY